MAISTIRKITITNSGFTEDTPVGQIADIIYLSLSANLVLTNDVDIYSSTIPPNGFSFVVVIDGGNGSVNLNGNIFRLNGTSIVENQLKAPLIFYQTVSNNDWDTPILINSQDYSAPGIGLDGSLFVNGSVTLDKLVDLTRGYILVGNSSNRPIEVNAKGTKKILMGDGSDLNSVTVSGDIYVNTTSGEFQLSPLAIVDADVSNSAAINRYKLVATGADEVCINSSIGKLDSEPQLASVRGGLGIDASSSTGFVKFTTGNSTISSIAVDRDLDVSFESGETGDFKILMGFPGTLTNMYAYATKAIAGTDNGTIVPKNNAGTTMATGTITFTAGDTRGTAYTATPSTNNTFVAGDILTFTTAKTTAGGKVHLSLKFTRTS